MRAYGERMHKGRYVLEDYSGWSRNHNRARSISKAKSLAQSVKNVIGFSLPKEGPLSDADEYMPDFMELLAKGISSDSESVLDKIKSMAEQIRGMMQGDFGSLGIPEMAFAGAGATNNTTNKTTYLGGVNITVNGYNVQDDDALAERVANKINEMLDEDGSVFK